MPNARVGAMPNIEAPPNEDGNDGRRRRSKNRGQTGITMEVRSDLVL